MSEKNIYYKPKTRLGALERKYNELQDELLFGAVIYSGNLFIKLDRMAFLNKEIETEFKKCWSC